MKARTIIFLIILGLLIFGYVYRAQMAVYFECVFQENAICELPDPLQSEFGNE